MDSYLNEDYLESLTELARYLTTSNIEITCDDSLGVSGLDTEIIGRCTYGFASNRRYYQLFLCIALVIISGLGIVIAFIFERKHANN